MTTIAGHTFVDKIGERVCRDCGKTWVYVAAATKQNIHQNGWAHSGTLTEHEYKQIDDERERLWRLGMGM